MKANRRLVIANGLCVVSILFSALTLTPGLRATVKDTVALFQTNEQYWRAAVRKQPERRELHLLLALTLYDAGKFADAEQEFRTVKALYAGTSAAQTLPDYYIGLCLAHQDQPDEARIVLKQTLLLNDAFLNQKSPTAARTRRHRELKQNIMAALQDLPTRQPVGSKD